jgi:hypothetical protein
LASCDEQQQHPYLTVKGGKPKTKHNLHDDYVEEGSNLQTSTHQIIQEHQKVTHTLSTNKKRQHTMTIGQLDSGRRLQ